MSATLDRFTDIAEHAIAITDIPKHLPGKRVAITTPWRWATKGCRGVVLETFHIGGRRYTTKQALEEFHAKINADNPPQESEADVARRANEACSALEKLGC